VPALASALLVLAALVALAAQVALELVVRVPAAT